MISNLSDEAVKQKIANETSANAAVKKVYEYIISVDGSYRIDKSIGGLVFIPDKPLNDSPSRFRLKIWQPNENQLLAWFYRVSAIPHSRDRFSYGGVVWDLDKVDLSKTGPEVAGWLEWLESGLTPEHRPSNWESAFEYDIPE